MSEIGIDSSDVPVDVRLWLPPVWEDCPFLSKLPADVEVRRGPSHGEDTVVISWGNQDFFYVSLKFSDANADLKWLAPALNNLAMSRLFAEFSDDKLKGLVLREARAIMGKAELSAEDSKMLARQKELNLWASTPRSPDRA